MGILKRHQILAGGLALVLIGGIFTGSGCWQRQYEVEFKRYMEFKKLRDSGPELNETERWLISHINPPFLQRILTSSTTSGEEQESALELLWKGQSRAAFSKSFLKLFPSLSIEMQKAGYALGLDPILPEPGAPSEELQNAFLRTLEQTKSIEELKAWLRYVGRKGVSPIPTVCETVRKQMQLFQAGSNVEGPNERESFLRFCKGEGICRELK